MLVEPQLGENIGAAARAMLNCGLTDLRLVAPRDGWPNPRAWGMASGADAVLDGARLYATLDEAVADLHRVYATTARHRDLEKPLVTPRQAALEARERTVIALVPAAEALTTTVNIPVRGAAKLLATLPFALEDQLAEDVEKLHFASESRRKDGQVPVAVVAR